MKISKMKLVYFFKCRDQYYSHIKECIEKDCNYDFREDELCHVNWGLYYSDMIEKFGREFGEVLFFLIDYARNNNLTVDNVANALRALNIEVEE